MHDYREQKLNKVEYIFVILYVTAVMRVATLKFKLSLGSKP